MKLRYRVIEFWKKFLKEKEALETALKGDDREALKRIEESLNEALMKIAGCRMECEFNEDGFFEMTFDTGANKTAQYICALIKKDAPEVLKEDWIINAFRQPLSERALHTTLNWKEKSYTGVDFKVYYTIDENLKGLQIKLYCEAFKGMDEVRQKEIASYMLELFVGELELEARILHVEVIEELSDEEDVVLLPNFYEDICDIVIDKDWQEYQDPTMIYNAYKLNEELKGSGVRKDMIVVASSHPLLFEELANKEYDSCRDMRDKGGEYGYFYYEHAKDKENVAILRAHLEKQIHELLYPLSIARTIGGAVGIDYCYIDVAVFDKDALLVSLERMNEKLPVQLYYRSFLDI